MLKIALLVCFVAYVVAQGHTGHVHTGHPHANHGQNDQFHFHYDEASGRLSLMTKSHCYLMDLTDTEKMDMREPLKKEMLEILMVTLAGDPTKQTAVKDASSLIHTITPHCHQLPIMQLTH